VQLVLADPVGSGWRASPTTGQLPAKMTAWMVEGIGGDSVPPVADFSRVSSTYSIPDAEAFRTCRELLAREGIIAGTSTGTLLAAALRYCRAQQRPQRVVTFVCDSGNKYLSKVYNDYWMLDQGVSRARTPGRPARSHRAPALRARRGDRELDRVGEAAYRRMKLYDVSQVPVMHEGRIVGIVVRGGHPAEVSQTPSTSTSR